MAACAIGSVWATGSWLDTAWECGTWDGAVVPVPVVQVNGASHPVVRRERLFVGTSAATARIVIRAFGRGEAQRGGRGLARIPLALQASAFGQKSVGSGEVADVHLMSLPYRRQFWPVPDRLPETVVQKVYMPMYLQAPRSRPNDDEADLLALLELE